MSERYSKLFALAENLYATGSPVVIAAGALLKDNQSGKIIAQIKLRNIHRKAIKAAKVCIVPFDTVGCTLGDAVHYQYLDLSAARNEEFGQKVPIALPDAATRSFAATVEEIAFADNSIWKATGEPWEVLPVPSSISKVYGSEFEKQFKIEYGQNCKNLPLAEKDLWYCVCGALNREEEKNCHFCNKQFAAISSYDVDDLNAKKDKRLAEEKAKAEKDAAEAAVQAEKNKKMAVKIGVIAAVATVIVVAASFVATKIIIPSNNYKAAEAMLAEGDYDGAIAGFTALADYKDSADRVIKAEAAKLEAKNAAAYAEAEAMLANKNYESAIAAFEALGDYKDSATQILETKYQRAVEWIEETKMLEAYEAFLELGDYKDSKEYFSDLYFIPTSISSDKYTYQFSYDENVQMYYAARTKFGITYEYSFSDGCAESVIRKGKTENDSSFVWKEDGTVEEYKTGTEGVEKYYDTYGNCISVRKADGEYKNGENELDAAHNVVKGIHLYDLWGGTTAENYYDDYGNLTYVSRAARNDINNSLFTYSLSYIKDVPVDMDVIWKNVRIICGQDVWHYY